MEHQQMISMHVMKQQYHWKQLETMDFKTNVNATCFEGQITGFGVVVRDKANQYFMAAVRRTIVQWALLLAEIYVIWFGLKTTEEFGFQLVEVESDTHMEIQYMLREEMTKTMAYDACAWL
ncbi:unnamed protein product [Linum trigynum]|uniref:RNase H type-1 domain-containing protein n=1 Tax=Linum trigynum TaxID=586398 RepID=A0AAV2CC36_9ROSI